MTGDRPRPRAVARYKAFIQPVGHWFAATYTVCPRWGRFSALPWIDFWEYDESGSQFEVKREF